MKYKSQKFIFFFDTEAESQMLGIMYDPVLKCIALGISKYSICIKWEK